MSPAAPELTPTRAESIEATPAHASHADGTSEDTTPDEATPDEAAPPQTVVGEPATQEPRSILPPPAESAPARPPGSASTPSAPRLLEGLGPVVQGEVMLRLVDHHAKEARRERLVTGSIGLAAAGLQLALGIVGHVELADEGTAMRRSAVGQMIIGSLGIASSVAQLAIRSSLERMRRSPTYARLEANPGAVESDETLRSDWQLAAKKGRRRRFVFGGVGLGVGALLTAVASARLADSDTTSGERIWAYSTVGTAIGVVFGGVAALSLPSESERSFAAIEAAQPRPQPQVRVSPSLGGLTVQGRF